jgi:hypothetical protein
MDRSNLAIVDAFIGRHRDVLLEEESRMSLEATIFETLSPEQRQNLIIGAIREASTLGALRKIFSTPGIEAYDKMPSPFFDRADGNGSAAPARRAKPAKRRGRLSAEDKEKLAKDASKALPSEKPGMKLTELGEKLGVDLGQALWTALREFDALKGVKRLGKGRGTTWILPK